MTVLTGFLGSGKSTLLNGLLRHPHMPPVAIIVNEFGEIAIDHALIEGVVDGVMLLAAGCVCCAVKSDLEGALRDLHLKRMRGLLPPYRAAVLETTGLADPGPVLQTLSSRAAGEYRYRLGQVIATLDAEHGSASLAAHREATRQLAVADRIILTKTDLVPCVRALEAEARQINPTAPILRSDASDFVPELIFGDDIGARGRVSATGSLPTEGGHHRADIAAWGRAIDGPMPWDGLEKILRRFLELEGAHVLRLKGIVRVEGVEGAVALHGVHHRLYPPDVIPVEKIDIASGITVIGDALTPSAVDRLFAELGRLSG